MTNICEIPVRCKNTGLRPKFIIVSLLVEPTLQLFLIIEPVNHELLAPRYK